MRQHCQENLKRHALILPARSPHLFPAPNHLLHMCSNLCMQNMFCATCRQRLRYNRNVCACIYIYIYIIYVCFSPSTCLLTRFPFLFSSFFFLSYIYICMYRWRGAVLVPALLGRMRFICSRCSLHTSFRFCSVGHVRRDMDWVWDSALSWGKFDMSKN